MTRAAVDLVRAYLGQRSLRILDVGGAAASLARFLPADQVLAIDMPPSDDERYVRGSGTHLPFQDGAFQVLACHDTLEHVPAELREQFLSEMLRVSSDLVIVQGPFAEPHVQAAERLVMNIARQIMGDDSDTVHFLQEHARFGLPDLRGTLEFLEEAAVPSIALPNGPLDEWVVKMLIKHFAFPLVEFKVPAHEFDRWSNGLFIPGFEPRPSYRQAVIASRTGDQRLLKLLQERLRVPMPGPVEGDDVPMAASTVATSLATFVELIRARLGAIYANLTQAQDEIAGLDKEARTARRQLAVQAEIVAELEQVLEDREQILNATARDLEAIRASFGYRMLEGYRGFARRVFPYNSWRGLPYRAARKGLKLAVRTPGRAARLLRSASKARQRYGSVGMIGKSIDVVTGRTGSAVDPVPYALSVDWNPAERAPISPSRPPSREEPVINWVIPTVGEGGGLRTIFRFVEFLENHGFRSRIYEMPVARPPRGSKEELRAIIRRYFGVSVADVSLDFENMEPADITFATSWHTAYPMATFNDTYLKCYFVQDFEPYFAPVGTESALTENTYRMGFHGITAGRWLSEKLAADYGMECDYFDLSVDTRTYFPKEMGPRRKVFFYARPATPRRGFELGVRALEVFRERNPGYQVVMAGGDIPSGTFSFPVTDVGYVSEERLNDLYNQSAAALVISLTNCSLLPLEIMATGCPVVTTVGDNNEKILPPNSAVLAVPSPHHIAAALEQAVKRPFRQELVDAATQYQWEAQTKKVAAVLRRLFDRIPAR